MVLRLKEFTIKKEEKHTNLRHEEQVIPNNPSEDNSQNQTLNA